MSTWARPMIETAPIMCCRHSRDEREVVEHSRVLRLVIPPTHRLVACGRFAATRAATWVSGGRRRLDILDCLGGGIWALPEPLFAGAPSAGYLNGGFVGALVAPVLVG